uniref:Uncharacterized protein n=1 Tax=Sphaerodactylus townsendi TaxID=933632 RepID=A0ACB8FQ97_9SAUR
MDSRAIYNDVAHTACFHLQGWSSAGECIPLVSGASFTQTRLVSFRHLKKGLAQEECTPQATKNTNQLKIQNSNVCGNVGIMYVCNVNSKTGEYVMVTFCKVYRIFV